MTSVRKLKILYYNLFLKYKEVVVNATMPIYKNLLCIEDINDLMKCIINDDNIDMVIVDYDGDQKLIDLVEAIHHYNQDLLIFFITEINNDIDKIKAYNAGVIEYFVLPINSQILQSILKNMANFRDSRIGLYNKTNFLEDKVIQTVNIVKERELESLLLLGRVSEYKDKDTASHILRVGKYSSIIIDSLGGSAEDKELMFYAAALHDVGKVGISDAILNKSTKLTDEEYNIIKTHTTKGYEILSGTQSKYLQAGATIALSHHEKYDGSGYPQQLKGENIPLYGRIVAVADVFDALVSERVYKSSWSLKKALDYIRNQSGTHFDPLIVNKFLAKINEIEQVITSLPPENMQKCIRCIKNYV